MRIALVYDCLYPHTVGGAERWLRELALALAAEHEVTYVTRRQWGPDEDPIPGIRCRGVAPGSRLYTAAGRRRLVPALRFGAGCFLHFVRNRRRYDIVHCLSYPYVPLVAARAAALHPPDARRVRVLRPYGVAPPRRGLLGASPPAGRALGRRRVAFGGGAEGGARRVCREAHARQGRGAASRCDRVRSALPARAT